MVIGEIDVETLSGDELANLAQHTTIYSSTPIHKKHIVTLLKRERRMMVLALWAMIGINDAPAARPRGINHGISVWTALFAVI